jgi:hypothetical protein
MCPLRGASLTLQVVVIQIERYMHITSCMDDKHVMMCMF